MLAHNAPVSCWELCSWGITIGLACRLSIDPLFGSEFNTIMMTEKPDLLTQVFSF